MNQKYLDFVGKKHARLTILSITQSKGQKPIYHCICDCGNKKDFVVYNITRTHSCGCYRVQISKDKKTHGQSGNSQNRTQAYKAWVRMKDRCSNTKSWKYKYYGGKGVKVCDEWQSFENFFKDMGHPVEGMTLDRIDVNGNYEPSNCRWATMMEQAKNKTNNMFLIIDGEKIHLMEASRRFPVKFQTIWARIKKYGWTDRQAVGLDPKPPRKQRSLP
jgi:hypothetical protein